MSAERLSGNFSYYTLKQAVRKEGVKEADLNAALKKIAAANNIDDITQLDGSEKISFSTSVFSKYITTENTNQTNPIQNEETLEIYSSANADLLNPNKVFKTNINDLPEVYNDDEYDVVDYDEFYGFNANNTAPEGQNPPLEGQNPPPPPPEGQNAAANSNGEQQDNIKLDFDGFKNQFGNLFENQNLENVVNTFDRNSDSYLDGRELEGANLLPPKDQENNITNSQPTEEDTMKLDLSGSDMSNDSFSGK